VFVSTIFKKAGDFKMAIYMNYNDIKGDVTAKGHEGWVQLDSFGWGAGRALSSRTGRSADRESSAPTIQEITISKSADISSTKLLNEALRGEGQKVVIDFCKTDKDLLEIYMQYTLENCMVSSYSVSGSGGDHDARPHETLSLNFTKIEYKNTGMKDNNETGDPDAIAFSVKEGKVA